MSTAPNEQRVTVLHIVSTSYAGSTWLNLLLAGHSGAFAVGELKRTRMPRCAMHPDGCEFWGRYSLESPENPFLQVARLCGKNILVVNNARQLLPDHDHPRVDSRFIHLMRDGRVVCASMIRKFQGMGMWKAARRWKHDVKRDLAVLRRHAPDAPRITYEALQRDTEGELRKLCDRIGLGFEPAMLTFWEKSHHFLGGSRGALFSLLQQSGREDAERVIAANARKNWNPEHYKQQDARRFRDERWKTELSRMQLRLFGLLAGGLNQRFGYPRSVEAERS